MKKESLISIVFCITFIVLVAIIYMGKTYLRETVVQDNVAEMVTIFESLPSLGDDEEKSYVINERFVSKFLRRKMIYKKTSALEGAEQMREYAKINGWAELKRNSYQNECRMEFKKGDWDLFVYHIKETNAWNIGITKYDWIWNLGF